MESSKPKRRPRITNNYIPEEIITEILSRLPVKPLLRFKCVSKSWRCLISSKRFVKTHLENSKKNQSFAHHRIISPCLYAGVINSCPMYPLLTEQSIQAPPLDNPTAYLREIYILGSCDGLICTAVVLGSVGDQFSLFNIATRESKELPDFFVGVEELEYCVISRYGFGFDESSGDYKVFALFYMVESLIPWSYAMGKIYSLKANSWGESKVYNDEPPFEGTAEDAGKFASGKLHWVRKTESKWEIVCLDLTSESFGVVEKPSFMEDDFVPRLGVHDGCLCLFCECPNRYDMWIWNKYGAEEHSWVKFASISYLSDSWKPSFMAAAISTLSYPYFIPLCMLPNGEVFFNDRSNDHVSNLVIYNPKDNGFRLRYINDSEDAEQAEVYYESLVSLVLNDGDESFVSN